MTTYNFDGFIVHEEGDLVDDGNGDFEMDVLSGIVEQDTFGFIASDNTNSFSYTVNEIEQEPNGSSYDVTITGFGDAYALDLPSISEYVTVMDADYDYASVLTMSWDDGTVKSATILAVGWEYEDFNAKTFESTTMVITLDGDALPPLADYDAFETFLDGTLFAAVALPGYQPGDNILLSSVDDYVSKAQEDLIQGSDTDDEIVGRLGSDTINGLDGNDTIYGNTGFDTLRGNDGDDVIYGGNRADEIAGGDGNDILRGQNGNDTVFGGAGQDTVYLGNGRDVFNGATNEAPALPAGNTDGAGVLGDIVLGGNGKDIIRGGSGDDLFRGQDGNDKIRGRDGDDTLRGGNGNDKIFGGNGDDIITGGNGNDRLFGGDGRDDIFAGSGNDTLTGGASDDGFIFKNIETNDANVIRDHELGVDFIEIFIYDDSTYSVQGSDTLITLDNGATILVEGVTDTAALQNDIEYLFEI